ncbi:MAG: glycosyltransferase family 39 protein [Bacteroidota bacterium]
MKIQTIILQRWRLFLWLVIPLVSLLMHGPLFNDDLSGVHMWRQTETASNVYNFYRLDDPITDPRVFHLDFQPNGRKRMEFPVMQYAMAVGYRIFGEEVWVLRGISWGLAILGIWGVFFLILALFRDRWTALLGAWCYAFSPVLFYYAINPLPDNLSLTAGVWGLAFFLRWYRTRGYGWLWLSAVALMFSTLAKLPFIVFYMLPLAFIVQDALRTRFGNVLNNFKWGLPYLLLAAPALAWYLWVIPTWNNGVTSGILSATGEDWVEIGKILFYTVVSTLPELLINYAALPFFLVGMMWMWNPGFRRHRLFVPLVAWAGLIFAYYLFEVNMIATAHDYYLFPFLPGIFLIVAAGLAKLMESQEVWVRRMVLLIMLVLPATCGIRTYYRWQSPDKIKALYAHREALRVAVPEDARLIVGHDLSPHIYLYTLRHFGWNFNKDVLQPDHVQRALKGGAEYYISDDRELDAHPLVVPILGEMVAEMGPWRVYGVRQ